MLFWNIAIPLGFIDMIVAGATTYIIYKYFTWKTNVMLKKKFPTKSNGLNLDISYKIEDNEVFGVHARGVDVSDLIENMLTAFRFKKKKE